MTKSFLARCPEFRKQERSLFIFIPGNVKLFWITLVIIDCLTLCFSALRGHWRTSVKCFTTHRKQFSTPQLLSTTQKKKRFTLTSFYFRFNAVIHHGLSICSPSEAVSCISKGRTDCRWFVLVYAKQDLFWTVIIYNVMGTPKRQSLKMIVQLVQDFDKYETISRFRSSANWCWYL